MKLEIPDAVADTTGFDDSEMLEFLSVCLYKAKKINGVQGGKILGTSEIEFHGLLEKYGQYVNYGIDDFQEEIDNLTDF
ncbi:hypothetical protein E4656_03390 [Natronospirillum operosum]|uniref:Uncharacterized protein n=1 Tax=Natronospirillum operosum TaxID=2759953 RepID=A0A4Z0WEM0_9GAMM|nr:UPF0175 family protein [Natronospirillum operosum]TGG95480.1 hypothetical protein E4656_03390 [Natronospirillum operosum]